jgi:hypothetical protein
MKKRLGAFLLAIVMTLSLGVIAPVSAAQKVTQPELEVSDGKITSSSGTTTLNVTLKTAPTDGLAALAFTATGTGLTVTDVKAATGTVTTATSGYTWSASGTTPVTEDGTKLFTITVKRDTNTTVYDGEYTLTVASTAAYAFDSSTNLATSALTAPESKTGTVTVVGVNPAAKITTQPKDVSTLVGVSATTTVAATERDGSGTLTYQWYKDDGTNKTAPSTDSLTDGETTIWTAIEGATDATYTPVVTAATSYFVFCKVTDTISSVAYTTNSDTAKVTVSTAALDASKIVLSFTQPKDSATETVATTATNTVTYTGKEITAAIDAAKTKEAFGAAVDSGEATPTAYYTLAGDTAKTAPGTYTATVTGDGTHLTGTAKVTWTIKPGTLAFASEDDAKYTANKNNTFKAADLVDNVKKIVTVEADQSSIDITLVKSSNTSVLTVDKTANTAYAKATGTADLTATVSANNYTTATLTFKVTVIDKTAATVEGTTATSVELTKIAFNAEGTPFSSIFSDFTATEGSNLDKAVASDATGWTFAVTTPATSSKKAGVTTTYNWTDFKAATVTALGKYTVVATYEDDDYLGSVTKEVTVVAADKAEDIAAATDLTLFENNVSEQTYGVSLSAMQTAIKKANTNAASGLALASGTNIVVKKGDTESTDLTAKLDSKGKNLVVALASTADGETTTTAQDGATYTITLKFTSDCYTEIDYVITVNVKAKTSAGLTLADGELTYTGKALSYEKGKLSNKKLKTSKITYTYEVDSTVADNNAKLDPDTKKPLNAGTYIVTAIYDDGTNYDKVTAKLVVNQKVLTITSATVKKTYDGTKALATSDITKAKISGAVKSDNLAEGVDYTIVAADTDAFSDVKVGSKYKVKLTINFEKDNADGTAKVAMSDKSKNYTIATGYTKTVTGTIAAKEIKVSIGYTQLTDKATDTWSENSTSIPAQSFTGKAIKLTTDDCKLAVWSTDTLTSKKEKHLTSDTDDTTDHSNCYEEVNDSLVEGTDYTVAYSSNTKVGTAKITVTAKKGSNYTFSKTTATFEIKTNAMTNTTKDDGTVTEDVYKAEPKEVTITYGTTPKASVLGGTVTLVSTGAKIKGKWTWTDGTAEAISKLNVGTYTNVELKASNTGTFANEENSNDNTKYVVYYATFTPTNKSYSAIKVPIKITVNQANLTISGATISDLTYSASDTGDHPTNVTAVTFKSGKTKVELPVYVASSVEDGYVVSEAKYAKTTIGSQKVTVKIELKGQVAKNYKLTKDTYSAKGKIVAASETITINFTDSKLIPAEGQTDVTGLTYTGKALKPEIKVTYGDADTELSSKEYTVKYTNNTNVGTATVTVTAKSKSNVSFKATSATFPIVAAELTTVTPKDLTVTYTGKAITKSQISGTAKFGSTKVAGTWAFDSTVTDADLTNVCSSAKVKVVFTPTSKNYAAKTVEMSLTIKPITVTIKKVTAESLNLGTLASGATEADVTVNVTFDKSMTKGESNDYTVTAKCTDLTAGTKEVSYTIALSGNYTLASGSSLTGKVNVTLTGELGT